MKFVKSVASVVGLGYGYFDDDASGKVAMPNVVSFDVAYLPRRHPPLRIHHPNRYHNQQARNI